MWRLTLYPLGAKTQTVDWDDQPSWYPPIPTNLCLRLLGRQGGKQLIIWIFPEQYSRFELREL